MPPARRGRGKPTAVRGRGARTAAAAKKEPESTAEDSVDLTEGEILEEDASQSDAAGDESENSSPTKNQEVAVEEEEETPMEESETSAPSDTKEKVDGEISQAVAEGEDVIEIDGPGDVIVIDDDDSENLDKEQQDEKGDVASKKISVPVWQVRVCPVPFDDFCHMDETFQSLLKQSLSMEMRVSPLMVTKTHMQAKRLWAKVDVPAGMLELRVQECALVDMIQTLRSMKFSQDGRVRYELKRLGAGAQLNKEEAQPDKAAPPSTPSTTALPDPSSDLPELTVNYCFQVCNAEGFKDMFQYDTDIQNCAYVDKIPDDCPDIALQAIFLSELVKRQKGENGYGMALFNPGPGMGALQWVEQFDAVLINLHDLDLSTTRPQRDLQEAPEDAEAVDTSAVKAEEKKETLAALERLQVSKAEILKFIPKTARKKKIMAQETPAEKASEKTSKAKETPAEKASEKTSKAKETPAEKASEKTSKAKETPAEKASEKTSKAKEDTEKESSDEPTAVPEDASAMEISGDETTTKDAEVTESQEATENDGKGMEEKDGKEVEGKDGKEAEGKDGKEAEGKDATPAENDDDERMFPQSLAVREARNDFNKLLSKWQPHLTPRGDLGKATFIRALSSDALATPPPMGRHLGRCCPGWSMRCSNFNQTKDTYVMLSLPDTLALENLAREQLSLCSFLELAASAMGTILNPAKKDGQEDAEEEVSLSEEAVSSMKVIVEGVQQVALMWGGTAMTSTTNLTLARRHAHLNRQQNGLSNKTKHRFRVMSISHGGLFGHLGIGKKAKKEAATPTKTAKTQESVAESSDTPGPEAKETGADPASASAGTATTQIEACLLELERVLGEAQGDKKRQRGPDLASHTILGLLDTVEGFLSGLGRGDGRSNSLTQAMLPLAFRFLPDLLQTHPMHFHSLRPPHLNQKELHNLKIFQPFRRVGHLMAVQKGVLLVKNAAILEEGARKQVAWACFSERVAHALTLTLAKDTLTHQDISGMRSLVRGLSGCSAGGLQQAVLCAGNLQLMRRSSYVQRMEGSDNLLTKLLTAPVGSAQLFKAGQITTLAKEVSQHANASRLRRGDGRRPVRGRGGGVFPPKRLQGAYGGARGSRGSRTGTGLTRTGHPAARGTVPRYLMDGPRGSLKGPYPGSSRGRQPSWSGGSSRGSMGPPRQGPRESRWSGPRDLMGGRRMEGDVMAARADLQAQVQAAQMELARLQGQAMMSQMAMIQDQDMMGHGGGRDGGYRQRGDGGRDRQQGGRDSLYRQQRGVGGTYRPRGGGAGAYRQQRGRGAGADGGHRQQTRRTPYSGSRRQTQGPRQAAGGDRKRPRQ